MIDQHDANLSDAPHKSSQHAYPPSFRRRPIVVRDPKTGATRLVGGGNGGPRRTIASYTGSGGSSGGGGSGGGAGGAGGGNGGGSGGSGGYSRRPYDSDGGYDRGGGGGGNDGSMGFDDEGRAPIMKIVSGYRGRQIVVRDPSRRTPPGPQGALGVRGGVKKAPYYDRRGSKTSPYSDEYEEGDRGGRGGEFYDRDDEDDEDRIYSRDRDSDFDRDVDQRMGGEFDSRYEQKEYYRNGRSDGMHDDEDLTGKVVYVDNLSDDVTTTGLADLFGMVGAVKELRLLYDRQGNPNGSADIVFQRRADAEEAIKSLHNVPLNNRPMRLSMGNSL